MASIAEALALGLQYHRAGQLSRAEQVYRPILEHDPRNAEALARLGALALHAGRRDEAVRLIGVQKGPGGEQISAVRERFRIVDSGSAFDQQSGALMDSAAVMKNLDLVVTWDTASAHLAGALGVNTWLALSAAPDWRWLTQRADTPWYPTMRLFRQQTLGDWPAVFESMADELSRTLRVN